MFEDDALFLPAGNPRKRTKYEDGIAGKPQFSNNGVNRCLILAIANGTKENYEILSDFFGRLELDPDEEISLDADLKV